jgi:hypothetical protein
MASGGLENRGGEPSRSLPPQQHQQSHYTFVVSSYVKLVPINSSNSAVESHWRPLYTICKLENELEESVNMDKELAADVSRTFDCEECGEQFGNVSDLKCHKKKVHRVKAQIIALQHRLLEMGQQISDQKLNMIQNLSKLKGTEFIEKQTCRCTGWCGINHQKHSWKPIKSRSILKMIQSSGINFQP